MPSPRHDCARCCMGPGHLFFFSLITNQDTEQLISFSRPRRGIWTGKLKHREADGLGCGRMHSGAGALDRTLFLACRVLCKSICHLAASPCANPPFWLQVEILLSTPHLHLWPPDHLIVFDAALLGPPDRIASPSAHQKQPT